MHVGSLFSRTNFATLAVVAAFVASVIVASASATANATTTSHAVVGLGETGPGCTTGGSEVFCDSRVLDYKLAAMTNPFDSGSPAFGGFRRVNSATGGTFDGEVTCLRVVGNQAAVGGFLTRPSPELHTPFLIYVNDNGLPGGFDGISPLVIFGPGEDLPVTGFPFACPSPPAPLGYFALNSGIIFLH